jgi:hypothetical protein
MLYVRQSLPAVAANNGTPLWFQQTLNYLKSHPITISVISISFLGDGWLPRK